MCFGNPGRWAAMSDAFPSLMGTSLVEAEEGESLG